MKAEGAPSKVGGWQPAHQIGAPYREGVTSQSRQGRIGRIRVCIARYYRGGNQDAPNRAWAGRGVQSALPKGTARGG